VRMSEAVRIIASAIQKKEKKRTKHRP